MNHYITLQSVNLWKVIFHAFFFVLGLQADMYSVGVVMYELYQPFSTEMERIHCINQLRKGHIDAGFQKRWPVVVCLVHCIC